MGSYCFNCYRSLIWENEIVLKMDGGDSYSTIQMYLIPLNCTLKNG